MTIKAASFFVSCLLVMGLSTCKNKGENTNAKVKKQNQAGVKTKDT
jgi:hypothetical protein